MRIQTSADEYCCTYREGKIQGIDFHSVRVRWTSFVKFQILFVTLSITYQLSYLLIVINNFLSIGIPTIIGSPTRKDTLDAGPRVWEDDLGVSLNDQSGPDDLIDIPSFHRVESGDDEHKPRIYIYVFK